MILKHLLRPRAKAVQACRQCGCTEVTACRVNEVPCCWVEPDLCSACAIEPFIASAGALYWLQVVTVRIADDLDRGKPPRVERTCKKGGGR